MRTILSAVFLSALTAQACAEAVPQPRFLPTDSWSYHSSIQKGGAVSESHVTVSVMRIGSDSIVVNQKAGAKLQSTMFGLDWSRRRSVNGQETTVNQPLSFPLDVGKTWRLEFTEQNPTPQKLRETDVVPYKVVGWEDITVPAGKFHALKIEADGRWTADISPRLLNSAIVARQGTMAAQTTENQVVRGTRVSGRLYKCFWYVPDVKRWVKLTEESYAASGTLSQVVTEELESFSVDGAKKLESTPPKSAPDAASKNSI